MLHQSSNSVTSPAVTVFTATYNRGYLISKLYQSLKAQTSCDFEWIVMDDGSTDDTEQQVQRLLREKAEFSMQYKKIPHGGKHRAINAGVQMAKGRLFFIVDSDDQLTADAIETVLKWESSIAQMAHFAGIAGNKGQSQHQVWGTTFHGEWIDATSLEREDNNITGDKAEVFYTSVLKQYPFPEFDGEFFVTEAVVWNRIAEDGWKIRWFNKVIYLADYLPDGLTRNLEQVNQQNPQGYALNTQENIRHGNYSWRDKINIYYHYYTVVQAKVNVALAAKYLKISRWLMLYVVIRCKARDWMRKR